MADDKINVDFNSNLTPLEASLKLLQAVRDTARQVGPAFRSKEFSEAAAEIREAGLAMKQFAQSLAVFSKGNVSVQVANANFARLNATIRASENIKTYDKVAKQVDLATASVNDIADAFNRVNKEQKEFEAGLKRTETIQERLRQNAKLLGVKTDNNSLIAGDKETTAVEAAKLNLANARLVIRNTEKQIQAAITLGDEEELAVLRQQHATQLLLIRDREQQLAAARAQAAEDIKNNKPKQGPASRFSAFFGNNIGDTIAVQAGFIASYKAIQLVTQALSEGVKYVVDFDKAMYDLQAITASTSEQMVGLTKIIEDVSTTSHFSAIEVAGAAKTLGQAGYNVDQIGQALQGVVLLATATGESLDTAAGLATSVISQFHLQASDMAHVADVLVGAINGTKLTLEQLASGLQYAGNTASETNLTLEQTVSILGAMADTGIKTGSTLGTGLTAVLSELLNPSTKFLGILEKIGLKTEDVSLKSHTFTEVIAKLRDKGFDTADAFDAFGRRAAAAFLAIENDPALIDKLTEALKTSGAAAAANTIQMDSLSNKLDRLHNTLGLIAVDNSKGLVGLLGAIIDKLNELASFFRDHPDLAKLLLFGPFLGPIATLPSTIDGLKQTSGLGAYFAYQQSKQFGPNQDPKKNEGGLQGPFYTNAQLVQKQVADAEKDAQDRMDKLERQDLELKKKSDVAVKYAQDFVESVDNMFSHINDAMDLASKHIDNIIKENSDKNSPLYGRFSDAEISMLQKKQRDIGVAELQAQVNAYPKQIEALNRLLEAQQRSVGSAKIELGRNPDPEKVAARDSAVAQAQKDVIATREKIADVTHQQALAQDELNVSLGKAADANMTLGDQISYVLDQYAEQMNVQSQFKYNIEQNITQALDNARGSFSDFVVSVANGTKSIGQSFKDMAISILNSLLKMEADKLAAGIFGKIAGFASGFLGGGFSNGAPQLAAANIYSTPAGPGFAHGGFIRAAMGVGVTGRDSVPILAMPGEYMLRKSAVDLIGRDNLDRMNGMGNRVVSASAPPQMPAPPPGEPVNVYVVSPDQKPSLGRKDVLAIISEDIIKSGNTKKLIKQVQQGG